MSAFDMLRNLLESADPAESAKHSFDHYHARGLCYVNLLRSDRLTAKLYIFDTSALRLTPDGYVVNPHSHGYDFETTVVSGEVTNIIFEPGRTGREWHAHRYMSPMKGVLGSAPAGKVFLWERWREQYTAGESYALNVEEVHTIRVTKPTVLFLVQYHDVRERDTMLFTREPTAPSLDGLYMRMTPERVAVELDRVRGMVDAPRRSGWVSRMLSEVR